MVIPGVVQLARFKKESLLALRSNVNVWTWQSCWLLGGGEPERILMAVLRVLTSHCEVSWAQPRSARSPDQRWVPARRSDPQSSASLQEVV